MNNSFLIRTWLMVSVLGLLGVAAGMGAGYYYAGRQERFSAQATLAMLPTQDIPVVDAPSYWDVLNQGQATRSAAVVLGDSRWLDVAASNAGVPKSQLALSAGAMPETTLIAVTMAADSAEAAESALDSVLKDGTGVAASASGPFRLEVVKSPEGSARTTRPKLIQTLGALAIGGLLVGAGVGLSISRSVRRRLHDLEEPGEAESRGARSYRDNEQTKERGYEPTRGLDHDRMPNDRSVTEHRAFRGADEPTGKIQLR